MVDHASTCFLVDRLGREQVQTIRLLPVLVFGSKVQIEHMTHYRGNLLRYASSNAIYLERHLLAQEFPIKYVDREFACFCRMCAF